jgi:hypothetical protein
MDSVQRKCPNVDTDHCHTHLPWYIAFGPVYKVLGRGGYRFWYVRELRFASQWLPGRACQSANLRRVRSSSELFICGKETVSEIIVDALLQFCGNPRVHEQWHAVTNMCNNVVNSLHVNPWHYETRGYIQKFQDWLPGVKTANGTALCH